eukprot:TRINITY_DN1304_c0_g1_i1.p1 TRINITY_DN1304_c0_g1~~TRINITY_DN1304_c0_g1_i1.p1  ORF type:complete len:192 (+),score=28.31 TRINITY_DN1304_c0_g1_i1:50-625(+)
MHNISSRKRKLDSEELGQFKHYKETYPRPLVPVVDAHEDDLKKKEITNQNEAITSSRSRSLDIFSTQKYNSVGSIPSRRSFFKESSTPSDSSFYSYPLWCSLSSLPSQPNERARTPVRTASSSSNIRSRETSKTSLTNSFSSPDVISTSRSTQETPFLPCSRVYSKQQITYVHVIFEGDLANCLICSYIKM